MTINVLLDELYDLHAYEAQHKKLEFRIEKRAPENAAIFTDHSIILHIFANLIKNAVKFTASGFVAIGYIPHANSHEFYVKDSGMGIEPEKQAYIFDRFSKGDPAASRFYEGTGLGLAIAKAYCETLSGSFALTSTPGNGSVFSFTVPDL